MPGIEKENFSINIKTKTKLSSLVFANEEIAHKWTKIKEEILGKSYDLNVNIVSKKEIQKINKIYREKNEATDILSFPLDQKSGEIFINLEETKKMAPKFNRDFLNFTDFLFIHGLVHLLGHDHGEEMDKKEAYFRKKFEV